MVRASAAEVTVPAFKKQHLDKFHSSEGAAFGAIHSEISIATGDPISSTVRSGGRGGLHPAVRAPRTEDHVQGQGNGWDAAGAEETTRVE